MKNIHIILDINIVLNMDIILNIDIILKMDIILEYAYNFLNMYTKKYKYEKYRYNFETNMKNILILLDINKKNINIIFEYGYKKYGYNFQIWL